MRIPDGLQWEKKEPEEQCIADATQKAQAAGYPDPPYPLRWAKHTRKQGIWLHRADCHAWVGWALRNLSAETIDVDPNEVCNHYDSEVKSRLKAEVA